MQQLCIALPSEDYFIPSTCNTIAVIAKRPR